MISIELRGFRTSCASSAVTCPRMANFAATMSCCCVRMILSCDFLSSDTMLLKCRESSWNSSQRRLGISASISPLETRSMTVSILFRGEEKLLLRDTARRKAKAHVTRKENVTMS